MKLEVDDILPIEKISVYYNIGQADNKSRYWREVKPIWTGKDWSAQLPTTDIGKNLVVFVNVYFYYGNVLSDIAFNFF